MFRTALLVLVMTVTCCARAQQDKFVIYFPSGVTQLTDESIKVMDSLIYVQALSTDKIISIIGYTDYIGTDHSNMQLSIARANNVKQYLLRSGFAAGNIKIVEGRGEIKTATNKIDENYYVNRKVEIIVDSGSVHHAKDTVKNTSKHQLQVFDLSKSAVNTTIRLNNLLFHGGSYMPLETSIPVMENLYKFMAGNPKVKIRIEGHVCCTNIKLRPGDNMNDEYMMLSTQRAKTVYDYLVANGIDKSRLSYIGFAGKRPLISPELNEIDRSMNRRVEIRILEK
ncbi:MAG: OmpA family protein [Sphingobacteriales bacterium]|nr:MAG: OmpA family protein [Sphingobacteriales bacterium]